MSSSKPQPVSWPNKCKSLERDIDRKQLSKEEDFAEKTSHILKEQQAVVDVGTGGTSEVVNKNEKVNRLRKRWSSKGKSHVNKVCDTEDKSFPKETPRSEVENTTNKHKKPMQRQRKKRIFVNRNIAKVPCKKNKALKIAKDAYGNNKYQKEHKKQTTVNAKAPKTMKETFEKNGNISMTDSKKGSLAGDTRVLEGCTSAVSRMIKSPIPENSNAKTSCTTSKRKGQELNTKKDGKDTSYKSRNECNGELHSGIDSKKVVSKSADYQVEHCAVLTSPTSSGEQKFRFIKTEKQIGLFNAKDEQKRDLDKRTVYFGNVPRDVDIFELLSVFEKVGSLESVRLMVNPDDSISLGFGFATFIEVADAQKAIQSVSNLEIREDRKIVVNPAKGTNRIFVGNVPKMSQGNITNVFSTMAPGLVNVTTFKSINANHNSCILEYESHLAASIAKRRIMKGTEFKLWVDWADSVEEPTDEIMASVKRVYLTNLSPETSEESIQKRFETFGTVERVKKIRHFAFVHFQDHQCALEAIKEMDGRVFEGETIKVVLSKPPVKTRVRQMEQRMLREQMYLECRRDFSQFRKPSCSQPNLQLPHKQKKSNLLFLQDQRHSALSCAQALQVHGGSSFEHPSNLDLRCHLKGFASSPETSTPVHSTPIHSDQSHLFLEYLPSCNIPGCNDYVCPIGSEPFCCKAFH